MFSSRYNSPSLKFEISELEGIKISGCDLNSASLLQFWGLLIRGVLRISGNIVFLVHLFTDPPLASVTATDA